MDRILRIIAAGILAAGFTYVSFVSLVIEPAMDFKTAADYANPSLILESTKSLVWYIGEFIYIFIGISCIYLAGQFKDQYLRIAGVISGFLFVFIGVLDRTLLDLPEWLGNEQQVITSVLGVIPWRLAAVKIAAISFGIFSWRVSSTTEILLRWPRLLRIMSYLILLAAIIILFIFVPMILLINLWCIVFFLSIIFHKYIKTT